MRWCLLIICIVTFANCESKIEETTDKGILDWFAGVFGVNIANEDLKDEITYENTGKPSRCRYCNCGIPRNDSRIINGIETKKYIYSWMGSLLRNENHTCGVSLINDLYGLTAAHCVHRANKQDLIVRFNLHSQTKPILAVDMQIEQIIVHESFQPKTFNNDIALLKFTRRIDFAESLEPTGLSKMRPVCLTQPNVSYIGRNVTVLGWGFTTEEGNSSDRLREVTVPVVTPEECQEGYPNAKITDKMLCAGYKDGVYDSCEEDSGGPAMVYDTQSLRDEQIGIVSWGVGCARPSHYGVYTNLAVFIRWIFDNTEDACYCDRP